MSTNAIEKMIEELKDLEALEEELKREIESVKNNLKAELEERNVEALNTGRYIVRFTPVTTSRFDSTRFKKDLPDIYKEYLKEVISKRFSIS